MLASYRISVVARSSFCAGFSLLIASGAFSQEAKDRKPPPPPVTIDVANCVCSGSRCVCPKTAPNEGTVTITKKQYLDFTR
jgi:hypothetical protein